MIFVTVGTQLPFDRMVECIDAWAEGRGEEVFAQIGPSTREFANIETVDFLDPQESARRTREARCIIAHAGMGTILSALGSRTPLLVMPRRADLGEHRNDHQLATARRLSARGLVQVAWDADELVSHLDRLEEIEHGPAISPHASDELLDAVRGFLAR